MAKHKQSWHRTRVFSSICTCCSWCILLACHHISVSCYQIFHSIDLNWMRGRGVDREEGMNVKMICLSACLCRVGAPLIRITPTGHNHKTKGASPSIDLVTWHKSNDRTCFDWSYIFIYISFHISNHWSYIFDTFICWCFICICASIELMQETCEWVHIFSCPGQLSKWHCRSVSAN